MSIQVQTVVTGPFQENTFIISDPETRKALIIDPGDESERLIQKINTNQYCLLAILNTHAHLDHIGAVSDLMNKWDLPFYLHKGEEIVLQSYEESCRLMGLPHSKKPCVDYWIHNEETLNVGPFVLKVIQTPGHTPGGITYLIENHVFIGDTLFYGSVGRTDLPGGNWTVLETSLRLLIQELDPEAIIHSGHGPDTTMKRERKENPFLFRL